MSSKFSVDFFSDSKYKCLTAEISFDGQILCQINKDYGIDNMEIEFFHEQREISSSPAMKFQLEEFIFLLNRTKSDLSEIIED